MNFLLSVTVALFLFWSAPAFSALELGVGMTSATGGRVVPSVAGALTFSKSAITGFSTGVASEIYYQSTYGLNYYRIWKAGDLWGGEVQGGFGVGVFYSERAFQDTGGASEESESDFGLGPAFRVNWSPLSAVYFNMEAIFGLRDFGHHLTMNFQDMVSFSLGVRI